MGKLINFALSDSVVLMMCNIYHMSKLTYNENSGRYLFGSYIYIEGAQCFPFLEFLIENCNKVRECVWSPPPPSHFYPCSINYIPTFAAPADFNGSSSCALYLASLAFRRPRWNSVAAGTWKQKWRWWALIRNASLVPALFCYLCSFGSLQFPSLFHWSSLVSPSLQASLIKHVLKFQLLQDSGDDPYQSGHHAMFSYCLHTAGIFALASTWLSWPVCTVMQSAMREPVRHDQRVQCSGCMTSDMPATVQTEAHWAFANHHLMYWANNHLALYIQEFCMVSTWLVWQPTSSRI